MMGQYWGDRSQKQIDDSMVEVVKKILAAERRLGVIELERGSPDRPSHGH